jgi:hypothetical protein
MAEELDQEFQLLDKAVFAHDPSVHAKWINEYRAWINGDHTGACPFETEDAYKRTHTGSDIIRTTANCVTVIADLNSDSMKTFLDREDARAKAARAGEDTTERASNSPEGFMLQALRLEAAQYAQTTFFFCWFAYFFCRYQSRVEIRDALRGTPLASDNVEQRRASLEAKIRIHEQARVFYMPDFVPPPSDADVPVERVSLHLPSSLGSDKRKRFFPPALVQAERDIRLAAMADALEDLLRQLRARTFLQRFSARNIQGKRAGTRSRSSIAGITRRVDAAAAAYRRHRAAYKTLTGADRDGWERIFRPLTAADVRGLSEKAISDEELHERYRITELAKALAHVARTTSQDAVEDPAPDEDDQPDMVDEPTLLDDDLMESSMGGLAEAVAPGEGTRKLSWIWVAGLQLEDVEDPQLTDGMSSLTTASPSS